MSLPAQIPHAEGTTTRSLATGQRTIHDPALTYPLWPPQTAGCPKSSDDSIAWPLEVTYDYEALGPRTAELLGRARMPEDVTGWEELLPPLCPELGSGIGSTPLVEGPELAGAGVQVLLKDESRNPTWSHKDRLNLCTVSAAASSGAPGVVVASSGNHGASAAALAARAGLSCIVVMAEGGPALPQSFVAAYGATVLAVPRDARWQVVKDIVDRLGFHPLSNQTVTHTGHPFGPEGYKTIAYELYLQLGHRLPGAVFVPTGYGELLYGMWKGFEELTLLGVTTRTPPLFACEVASRGVLAEALRSGNPGITVPAIPTAAYSMATTTGGYRGIHVMRHSPGRVVGVDDAEMERAQDELAGRGMWQELSGVAGLAGLRQLVDAGEVFDGPVVCVCTSSGLKDSNVLRHGALNVPPAWPDVLAELRRQGVTRR